MSGSRRVTVVVGCRESQSAHVVMQTFGSGVSATPSRASGPAIARRSSWLKRLDAEDPLDPARRLRRLLVAQDTGGAIRGVVRGDVFWGEGAEAEARAGQMRARGRYWVLLPRDLAAAGGERH